MKIIATALVAVLVDAKRNAISGNEVGTSLFENEGSKMDKVDVCHINNEGVANVININKNALDKHLENHVGDHALIAEGECLECPCNTENSYFRDLITGDEVADQFSDDSSLIFVNTVFPTAKSAVDAFGAYGCQTDALSIDIFCGPNAPVECTEELESVGKFCRDTLLAGLCSSAWQTFGTPAGEYLDCPCNTENSIFRDLIDGTFEGYFNYFIGDGFIQVKQNKIVLLFLDADSCTSGGDTVGSLSPEVAQSCANILIPALCAGSGAKVEVCSVDTSVGVVQYNTINVNIDELEAHFENNPLDHLPNAEGGCLECPCNTETSYFRDLITGEEVANVFNDQTTKDPYTSFINVNNNEPPIAQAAVNWFGYGCSTDVLPAGLTKICGLSDSPSCTDELESVAKFCRDTLLAGLCSSAWQTFNDTDTPAGEFSDCPCNTENSLFRDLITGDEVANKYEIGDGLVTVKVETDGDVAVSLDSCTSGGDTQGSLSPEVAQSCAYLLIPVLCAGSGGV